MPSYGIKYIYIYIFIYIRIYMYVYIYIYIYIYSKNLLYLLSCENFNFQYVVETAFSLLKGINIHRIAKNGFEHIRY